MASFLKKIFRFKTLGIVSTIGVSIGLIFSYFAPYVAPSSNKFLPFFGLAYAPMMIFLFVLLIFWIIAKSRWTFVLIAVLFCGIHVHFNYFTVGSKKTASHPANTLHIMSYNVRGFGIYHQEEQSFSNQFAKIETYVQQTNPDIICFQEFFDGKPANRTNTLTALKEVLSTGKRSESSTNIHKSFGVVTISKYPIIRKKVVALNNNISRCIYTDIKKGNDTIRVFNAHLQSIKLLDEDLDLSQEGSSIESNSMTVAKKLNLAFKIREKQMIDLVKEIESSPYKTIVCGDFNDTPLSYAYHSVNTHLIDTWKATSTGIGATYAGNLPVGRIDYIFASDAFTPIEFRVQDEKYSDHYAIESFLEIK